MRGKCFTGVSSVYFVVESLEGERDLVEKVVDGVDVLAELPDVVLERICTCRTVERISDEDAVL